MPSGRFHPVGCSDRGIRITRSTPVHEGQPQRAVAFPTLSGYFPRWDIRGTAFDRPRSVGMRPSPDESRQVPPSRCTYSDALFDILNDALKKHRRITFALTGELINTCGITNLEHAVVFLSDANSQATMRATVAHELIHLLCQDCPDEEVEAMAAEALVPLPAALEALASGSMSEVAARVGVDEQMMRARVRTIPLAGESQHGVG